MKKNVEHGRAKDKRKPVRDDPKGCRVYYYSLDMSLRIVQSYLNLVTKTFGDTFEMTMLGFCFSPYQLAQR